MDSCPIFFYKRIYQIMMDIGMYREERYLFPMQVAAFILAVKDARENILRDNSKLLESINREYDISPIVLNITDTNYFQLLVHDHGSKVTVKHDYSKVDFLSLLSSFENMEQQTKFIKSILNIYYPRGNYLFEKMLFNLNIDKMRESYCKNI